VGGALSGRERLLVLTRLAGRRSERELLDQMLGALRAGQCRALLVWGEPGVGKTALVEYLVGQAPDCRVLRTANGQTL
jgi:MoxR-like ATPase